MSAPVEKREGTSDSTNTGSAMIQPSEYFIYGHKRIVSAVGLALVLFISALDSTIVGVALPVIGDDFNDYRQASWVVTAYLLTYTAFLPIVSKFADILGRRPVLVFSTLFFMLWSGACGGAKTMNQLIVFRALQGIGGSAIYSAVVVTISTMVPREEIPKYTPVIGVVFALSSVAGPLVGGAIVSHIHWGWIFFVNLPIGAVGTALLMYGLSDPHGEQLRLKTFAQRLDWVGSLLLLAFSVLLSFALQVGGTPSYPWTSVSVLAPLLLSTTAFLPLFILAETLHQEPLVPLRLFRLRNFTFTMLFTLGLGAGFFTLNIFLPQRMQVVDGLSAIAAGLRMLPQLTLVGALSPLAGALVVATLSYRPLMVFSAALGAVGAGMLSRLTANTNFPQQYGFEAMAGFSIGVTITVSTMVVQFSTEREDIAAAMGFQSFMRQLGALVGIAAATAILNARVVAKLDVFEGVKGNPLSSGVLRGAITQNPVGLLKTLDPRTARYVREAYSDGFSKLFVAAAAWFAIGTVATLFLMHVLPSELIEAAKKKKGVKGGKEGVEAGDVAVVDCEKVPDERMAEVEERVTVKDEVAVSDSVVNVEKDVEVDNGVNVEDEIDIEVEAIAIDETEKSVNGECSSDGDSVSVEGGLKLEDTKGHI